MTGVSKHCRGRDLTQYIVDMLEQAVLLGISDKLALQFIRVTLYYMLDVGNVENMDLLVAKAQRLPREIKGELMTAAEKLREQGREEVREQVHEEIAINLLKDGVDPRIVARNTRIELSVILKLKAKIEEQ